MSTGATNIRLGALVGDFLEGMKKASAATKELTAKVNNDLTGSFRKADKEAKLFKGGITRLGDEIQSVGRKMSTFVTLPAIFAAGKAYKDFADLERLEKGLSNYGNTLEEVQELAKRPNIDIASASKALLGLRAVGVESDLAKRSVTAFANALTLAGGTAADLEPSLYNITQILSTNKVSADEIKEIAGRIPQVRKAIQDAFGTSDSEELKKAGIDAKTFVNGVITELEKLPQQAGGAQNAMDTFGDSMKMASGTMGEALDKTVGITTKITKLGEWVEKGAKAFASMSAGGQKAIIVLAGIAAAAGPVLAIVGGLVKMWPVMATGLTAINIPLVAGIATLVLVATYWEEIAGSITRATIAGNNFLASAASAVGLDTYAAHLRKTAAANRKYLDELTGVKYDPTKAMKLPGEMSSAGGGKKYPFLGGGFTGVVKTPNPDPAGNIPKHTEAIETLTKAEMELWRIDLAGKYNKEANSVKDATEEYKKLVGVVSNLDSKTMKAKGMSFDAPDKLGKLSGRAGQIGDSTKTPADSVDEYEMQKERLVNFNNQITDSFKTAQMNIAIGFGEMMGGVIAGTSGLQDLPKLIAGVFGQMLKDIGKSFVATAIAAQKFRIALLANPGLAIAAGIGMIAVGAALQATVNKSKTPAFAQGGMVAGPMTAIVGDNPNARFDNEMIAPYSKVDRSIRKSIETHSQGGMNIEVVGILKGEDMVLQVERVTKRKRLIGG